MSAVYLAGFFDGEGCIRISNNGAVELKVINTSLDVLKVFQKELGGNIGNRAQVVNKKQYCWGQYGEEAIKTLQILLEHLIDKRQQASVVIEWYNNIRPQFKPVRKEKQKGAFAHPLRAEAIEKYQKILTQMKLGTYKND